MGTACAIVLAEKPEQRVSLWARNADHASEMVKTRENKRLLPGKSRFRIRRGHLRHQCSRCRQRLLVMAVPTVFLRNCLSEISVHLTDDRPGL
ncbi:MAG: hypothetical protein CM1200mP2_01100 [Planctomycetaceae bacterium]|nr:MAG: hypothetical protein CM1200mP2_01100 [Planctomycetaceae bacterium]